MPLIRVAAVNNSSADAFPLGISAERDPDGETLTLSTEHGAFALRWGHGPARRLSAVDLSLESVGADATRGFVEDLARWLGVTPAGSDPDPYEIPEVSLVSLGRGREGSGMEWDGHKLFLSARVPSEPDPSQPGAGLYGEIFLRVTPDRTQAQLLEKWGAYRPRLPALFELVLGLPPRRWAAPPAAEVEGLRPGEQAQRLAAGVAFALPEGWTRTAEPGGSTRLVDPTDEFGFEVSVLTVAAGPPIVTILELAMDSQPHAVCRLPEALAHASLEAATGETVWMEPDPHRPPDADQREARCRWIVARRGERVALLTFTWWTEDGELALPHLQRAVETLLLARPPGE